MYLVPWWLFFFTMSVYTFNGAALPTDKVEKTLNDSLIASKNSTQEASTFNTTLPFLLAKKPARKLKHEVPWWIWLTTCIVGCLVLLGVAALSVLYMKKKWERLSTQVSTTARYTTVTNGSPTY